MKWEKWIAILSCLLIAGCTEPPKKKHRKSRHGTTKKVVKHKEDPALNALIKSLREDRETIEH